MTEFDSLSVSIAANTTDFNRGMDAAERSLSAFDRAALRAAANADIAGDSVDDLSTDALQTAASMQVLGSRTDNAGDQLSQTAVQAGAASVGLNSVSTSATGASAASLNLSSVLVASVAPALVVVAAAAVPVVAALGGLITVAGAIFGVGLVGALAAIATNSEQLKGELDALLGTIGDEFSFAIEQATAVLSILIGEFQDIIPELVPAESTISEIASLFDQLGTAIIQSLPAFVELAVSLTREFLPGMIRLAENVLPKVPGFLRDLVSAFRRLIPSFRRAGSLLVDLGPELLEFGFTALEVVGPALARLTAGLTNALKWFNQLDGSLQSLTVKIAAVAPIIAGIATLLGGPVTLALAGVVGAVIALRQAWTTNFAGIRDIVGGLNDEIQSVMPAARRAFNAFIEGVDIDSIVESLGDFERILDNQLKQTLEALEPVFQDFQALLIENKEEIEIIGGAVGGLLEGLIGVAQAVLRVLGPAFRQVGIPIIRGFITFLDGMISQLANLIQLFGALRNEEFGRAQEISQDIVETIVGTHAELIGQERISAVQDQAQRTVRLIVEEDTDLTEARIQEGAERVVSQRERRARRLADRRTGGF